MNRFWKLLCAALMLTFAQAAAAQGSNWVVSESAGKVMVRDSGGEHVAKRGTVVARGATLSTGPASRAIVVRGKDFVTVSANSRIRIPTQTGGPDVVQEWGNAVFQIEKQPNPHFGVRTPYLAAVVKGTTFSITVTADGASLQVLEGAVQTSTVDGGASEIIRPGILATVNASDRFRLTVRGQDTRNVDSPQRSQPAANGAEVEQAVPNAGATASDAQSNVVIEAPIAAQPVDLGKSTGGLLGGTVQVASVDIALTRPGNSGSNGNAEDKSNNSSSNSGNGNGNGNSGSSNGTSADNSGSGNSGNGNGNGNGNGSDTSGSGNGNSGNGNGNGATDPGTGNGNGNSGNGNGNGATDPGTGNGNGNSGNGNGNGATDPGTGNGNGNSGNGNGNGATDPGTGNGNGNGNGSVAGDPGTDPGVGNGNGNGNGKDDGGKAKGKP